MEPSSKIMARSMFNTLKGKMQTQKRQLMFDYTKSVSEQTKLAQKYSDAKLSINAEYENDDPQRQVALDEVKDEYDLNVAKLYEWQTDLETQKEDKDTKIEMYDAYIEKLDGEIAQETKEAHTYGYKKSVT